jgi:hypothetical protein
MFMGNCSEGRLQSSKLMPATIASYGYSYGVKALQPSNDSRESLVDDKDFETKLAVQENRAVNEIGDIMKVDMT